MTEPLPDERPQRRREYSGPASTLGLAALIVLAVGAAIWWFEFRGDAGGNGGGTPGLGVVELAQALNPTGKAPAARETRAAPNFTLAGLEEGALTLTDLRGSYVLLNFWASWCPPCRDETPDLQSFYEHNSNRSFTIVGVNQQERLDTAASFVDDFGVTYPVALDSSGEVSRAYGVSRALPMSFLVSPEGVIERIFYGRLSEAAFADIEARLR